MSSSYKVTVDSPCQGSFTVVQQPSGIYYAFSPGAPFVFAVLHQSGSSWTLTTYSTDPSCPSPAIYTLDDPDPDPIGAYSRTVSGQIDGTATVSSI